MEWTIRCERQGLRANNNFLANCAGYLIIVSKILESTITTWGRRRVDKRSANATLITNNTADATTLFFDTRRRRIFASQADASTMWRVVPRSANATLMANYLEVVAATAANELFHRTGFYPRSRALNPMAKAVRAAGFL